MNSELLSTAVGGLALVSGGAATIWLIVLVRRKPRESYRMAATGAALALVLLVTAAINLS